MYIVFFVFVKELTPEDEGEVRDEMEVPGPYNSYSICSIWNPSFANIFQVKIAKGHEQVAGIGIVCQTFGWCVQITDVVTRRFVFCFCDASCSKDVVSAAWTGRIW